MKFHLMASPSSPERGLLEVRVDGVGAGAVHLHLLEEREGDAEVPLAEGGDLGVVARLLVAELVAGEAEDLQPLGPVALVEGLEPLVLRA